MNSVANTFAQQDASNAAALNNLAVSLAHRDVVQQQLADSISQVAQGVNDTIGQATMSTASTSAQLQQTIRSLESRVAALEAKLAALSK
jgi:hypothetical protein